MSPATYLCIIDNIPAKVTIYPNVETIKNAYTNEILPYVIRDVMPRMGTGQPVIYIQPYPLPIPNPKYSFRGNHTNTDKIIYPLLDITDQNYPLLSSFLFYLDELLQ